MPVPFFKSLVATTRSHQSDLALACLLTFVAGATNAGGFLAVKLYTSHMSGIVATMADFLILGDMRVVFAGMGALMSFLMGAATTAVMVNWAHRENLHSVYALPLAMESALLLVFGVVGGLLNHRGFVSVSITAMLLCYLMGLQNALITKISGARIRTTHVTGMVTDIGIELGKLLYWNQLTQHGTVAKVRANRSHLLALCGLVTLFFCGGLTGAFGFSHFGFVFTLPLAILLGVVCAPPILKDLRQRQGVA